MAIVYNAPARWHRDFRFDAVSLIDTPDHESQFVEAVGPALHFGAVGAPRSTWLGPAWAALCGIVASSAFAFDALDVLLAAFVFILVDWAWPAIWTSSVRTDWRAPFAHWRETPAPARSPDLPYLQPGSPAARLLGWGSRAVGWSRSYFAPVAGQSAASLFVALIVGLALSAAIGWRAAALTLAALAVTGIGAWRAMRAALDSDWLRSIVYVALPWCLGHAAFAPPTVESALMGILFGLAYRALIESGERAPSPFGLIAPQAVGALALFAGDQPAAAFVVVLAVVAQAALRTFLAEHAFARRAQVWLMLAMATCAVAVA